MIIIVILITIAAIAEAVMDGLQFYYNGNSTFWNPKLSWVRKYKNNNPLQGERWWTSSTITVAFTDGWHFMKWIRNLALTLIPIVLNPTWKVTILTISIRILYGLVFTSTLKNLKNLFKKVW